MSVLYHPGKANVVADALSRLPCRLNTMIKEKGLFYKVYGAHPHPYMKPAFDAAKDFVVQSVADEIRKLL